MSNTKFLQRGNQLDVGDIVMHPLTGYKGTLIKQEDEGKWLVEWFANKEWGILKRSLRAVEISRTLLLLMKSEAA